MKRCLLLVLGMMALTGCSFRREWNAAIKKPAPANSIEGPWSGTWQSDANGHHGTLKCVVTKTSETSYRAHFKATYGKALRFSYVATLAGQETNGAVALKGESDLGKLAGGIYTYEGKATPIDFQSSYANKYDHGSYQMQRPAR
jgi:hypothetical protein